MARIIDRIGPVELRPRRLAPFESLVHSIIHQQLSGQAAGTILKRFKALFGNGSFPSPAALVATDVAVLRRAGISRPKAGYIKGLAEKALAGDIPSLSECDTLSDDEILVRMTAVKGVGRWTAEMLLIFNMGRRDVLPIHDLGIQRGFRIAYGKRKLPQPEKLQQFGGRWAPHRTVAALYLWKTADFLKDGDW
jgi:DNA-3-methyladenine glycosylase II